MIFKKIIRILITGILALFFVTSCGNDSTAPTDGAITFDPGDDISWNVALGACALAYPGNLPELQIYRITVRDDTGEPLGRVELDLSMILSSNGSGFPVSWLLLDLDGNGFFDGYNGNIASFLNSNEVITSGLIGSPYRTETNKFGWLDVGILTDLGGCSFTGYLSINSGSVGNVIGIDVAAS